MWTLSLEKKSVFECKTFLYVYLQQLSMKLIYLHISLASLLTNYDPGALPREKKAIFQEFWKVRAGMVKRPIFKGSTLSQYIQWEIPIMNSSEIQAGSVTIMIE